MEKTAIEEEVFSGMYENEQIAKKKCQLSKAQILGNYPIGSMNYDCYDEENLEYGCYARHSNVDSILVTVEAPPRLDDYKFYVGNTNNSCRVVSLDTYVQKLIDQDIDFLQTLITEHNLVNLNFSNWFKETFTHRAEAIAHIDPINHMLRGIASFEKNLEHARHDSRSSYHAFRLHSYLEDYYDGNEFKDCLVPLHPNKNQRIKRLRNGRRISRSEDKYLVKEVRRLRNKANKWNAPKNEELIKQLQNDTRLFLTSII